MTENKPQQDINNYKSWQIMYNIAMLQLISLLQKEYPQIKQYIDIVSFSIEQMSDLEPELIETFKKKLKNSEY